MKIGYFADTDTMLIEFRDVPVAETRRIDVKSSCRGFDPTNIPVDVVSAYACQTDLCEIAQLRWSGESQQPP